MSTGLLLALTMFYTAALYILTEAAIIPTALFARNSHRHDHNDVISRPAEDMVLSSEFHRQGPAFIWFERDYPTCMAEEPDRTS